MVSGPQKDNPVAARSGSEAEAKALPLLQMEYSRCCGEVERLLGQNDKALQYALAIISGFVYLSLKDDLLVILSLVPLVCAGVFLYIVNIHEFAMIARGYLAYLEGRINEAVGVDVLLWETQYAEKHTHYLKSTMVLAGIGASFGLLTSAYSLYKFHSILDGSIFVRSWAEAFFWIYSAFCLSLLSFGVFKILRLSSLRSKVEQCLNAKRWVSSL